MRLHNTLYNRQTDFAPMNSEHVKMYVCGPTVYSFPHIGNARSVVVYDLLFRLLRLLYKKVTYVRNITDVDDKIVAAAKKEGKNVKEISDHYTSIFQSNMKSLNCLNPTLEPKATEHINDMIIFIKKLLGNGNAYVVGNSVYFHVQSYPKYGHLSGRKLDDLIAGSRIDVDTNKKNPGDFILWKPTKDNGWSSPWGYGRPGWHIECSVMSTLHLGENFDIHGGGADLQFPHHENEVAQSCCAYPNSKFANYWIHNGFVLVNGKKMSKSIGNVLTVEELLKQNIKGSVIRLALLNTHYRKPLDWNYDSLKNANNIMNKFSTIAKNNENTKEDQPFPEVIESLSENLNTPQAISIISQKAKDINKGVNNLIPSFISSLKFLGLLDNAEQEMQITENKINDLINRRRIAKQNKDFTEADEIRNELLKKGIELLDNKYGQTTWKYNSKP